MDELKIQMDICYVGRDKIHSWSCTCVLGVVMGTVLGIVTSMVNGRGY